MLTEDLLSILCCPETHQSVALAAQAAVNRVNEQIAAGAMRNRGGKAVTEPIEGGLVRSDGKYLYPIRKSIPVLLIDEAIAL